MSIESSDGTPAASYCYDAWGKILASTGELAELNPLRYRGYVYDQETGFYYLQSRYYDPAIGRFINADSMVNVRSALSSNLFAYCLNNPSSMSDDTGNLPFFAITAAIGAAVGAVFGGVVAARSDSNIIAGIGLGAAAGALIGTGAGIAAGVALAGSITASTGAVMAGGSALSAAIGSGGLSAGVSYVTNNLSQASNGAATAAQVSESHMQQVYRQGQAGEQAANIVKNTMRIPDGLDVVNKILTEVKNYSGTLSYTRQLRDFVAWSQANGYTMHLVTSAKSFSGPLQAVIDSGIIQVIPLR